MVLHIYVADKFIPPFVSFINKNFENGEHLHFIFNKKNKYQFDKSPNIIQKNKINVKNFFELWGRIRKADKIILHGLFWNSIVLLLALNNKHLQKCYWGIWGGDLHKFSARNKSFKNKLWHRIRKFVISRIGNFITYLPEDYKLAQDWYGANGRVFESITYLSNVYKPILKIVLKKDLNLSSVLVGNSATPSNRHEDSFQKLLKFKGKVKLIVPLSYGNEKYGKKIASIGKEMFGEDFIPLMNFMPIDDYYKILSEIDTVVFNHNRQQGMGNIIQSLGQGKKVFLDPETPQFKLFERLGIKVFDVNLIDLSPLSEEDKKKNELKIMSYFSEENLILQLTKIFEKTLQHR